MMKSEVLVVLAIAISASASPVLNRSAEPHQTGALLDLPGEPAIARRDTNDKRGAGNPPKPLKENSSLIGTLGKIGLAGQASFVNLGTLLGADATIIAPDAGIQANGSAVNTIGSVDDAQKAGLTKRQGTIAGGVNAVVEGLLANTQPGTIGGPGTPLGDFLRENPFGLSRPNTNGGKPIERGGIDRERNPTEGDVAKLRQSSDPNDQARVAQLDAEAARKENEAQAGQSQG